MRRIFIVAFCISILLVMMASTMGEADKRAYHFFRLRRRPFECVHVPDYIKEALKNPFMLCPDDREQLEF
ncbi:hypothetical protein EG68_08305 [Paragonimus skrjabini miyazakii]|uniref:Uncharacterized protein n=1 Tax=Paragonimus skrjabini miyazakii TaxID=59628 RepID=A0A8S9YPC5_9TREM|nr:hypothetical protein EG68_08305 [Paragonimus skrjabini miyazakii]